ncbi:hypothetical protein EDC01DRAFT_755844 [Geopyxis carbonaria]|nr:hypothetical protein EDC01DRAFT_755844 [Geopyxis carbonaria]
MVKSDIPQYSNVKAVPMPRAKWELHETFTPVTAVGRRQKRKIKPGDAGSCALPYEIAAYNARSTEVAVATKTIIPPTPDIVERDDLKVKEKSPGQTSVANATIMTPPLGAVEDDDLLVKEKAPAEIAVPTTEVLPSHPSLVGDHHLLDKETALNNRYSTLRYPAQGHVSSAEELLKSLEPDSRDIRQTTSARQPPDPVPGPSHPFEGPCNPTIGRHLTVDALQKGLQPDCQGPHPINTTWQPLIPTRKPSHALDDGQRTKKHHARLNYHTRFNYDARGQIPTVGTPFQKMQPAVRGSRPTITTRQPRERVPKSTVALEEPVSKPTVALDDRYNSLNHPARGNHPLVDALLRGRQPDSRVTGRIGTTRQPLQPGSGAGFAPGVRRPVRRDAHFTNEHGRKSTDVEPPRFDFGEMNHRLDAINIDDIGHVQKKLTSERIQFEQKFAPISSPNDPKQGENGLGKSQKSLDERAERKAKKAARMAEALKRAAAMVAADIESGRGPRFNIKSGNSSRVHKIPSQPATENKVKPEERLSQDNPMTVYDQEDLLDQLKQTHSLDGNKPKTHSCQGGTKASPFAKPKLPYSTFGMWTPEVTNCQGEPINPEISRAQHAKMASVGLDIFFTISDEKVIIPVKPSDDLAGLTFNLDTEYPKDHKSAARQTPVIHHEDKTPGTHGFVKKRHVRNVENVTDDDKARVEQGFGAPALPKGLLHVHIPGQPRPDISNITPEDATKKDDVELPTTTSARVPMTTNGATQLADSDANQEPDQDVLPVGAGWGVPKIAPVVRDNPAEAYYRSKLRHDDRVREGDENPLPGMNTTQKPGPRKQRPSWMKKHRI